MEILDIYDGNRNKTGKTIIRGQKLAQNEFYLSVHIWIMNSKGEFLIQKRANCVKKWPDMWAMTGGAAVEGEDSELACIREMTEEIGIKPDMKRAQMIMTINRENNFCDIWLIKQDFDIIECKLQEIEVSEAKWATIDQINHMIDKEQFVNFRYLKNLFNKLKEQL